MIRRARLLSVLAILASGAVGVISSTQTWLLVTLADGAAEPLAVAGADAATLLAPLSLAALALGAALSIAGRVLRYVFGALGIAIAVVLGAVTWPIAVEQPVAAVSSAVTAATGITGASAIAELVTAIAPTVWPAVTLAVEAVLLAAGVFVVATSHGWSAGDRRYRAETRPAGTPAAGGSRPRDAVDSWDDLSRGEDPTA